MSFAHLASGSPATKLGSLLQTCLLSLQTQQNANYILFSGRCLPSNDLMTSPYSSWVRMATYCLSNHLPPSLSFSVPPCHRSSSTDSFCSIVPPRNLLASSVVTSEIRWAATLTPSLAGLRVLSEPNRIVIQMLGMLLVYRPVTITHVYSGIHLPFNSCPHFSKNHELINRR